LFNFSNTVVYRLQNKTLFRIIKVHESGVVQSYENKECYKIVNLSLESNPIMHNMT